MDKFKKAFKLMDLYIRPSPSFLRRMMILLDKKAMSAFYGYNTDDYYLYEFYRLRLSARKDFMGEDNGQRKITRALNDASEAVKFNNKAVFNELFAKYLHRDWLWTAQCTFDEFCDFCASHSDFIRKPVDQLGGVGIEKHTVSKKSDLSGLYGELRNEGCIIEETIVQDRAIASFNPTSVNSIRIYSILNKPGVIITDAYLRMGVGDAVVDNFHSGGIAAKIDVETGIITTLGKNLLSRTFISHPYTNKRIIGFEIPRWAEIKRTIEEAALVVPAVRYVAWDIVINNKGDICIIEGNHNGDFNLQEVIDLQGKKSKYEKLLREAR